MKALIPVKAQLMGDDELSAWFDGRIARRILTIPFGGPLPSAKSRLGVDLDGQYFDDHTDIYGPYDSLRETRERLADWHHAMSPPSVRHGDPTGMMTGHALGKSILDPDPEEDGWWSDFWWQAGQRRVALVKQLMAKGAQLFGSSQPAPKGVLIEDDGHIAVWPHLIQTLTTSPQNTYSVLRPAKALLDGIESEFDISPALRTVLDELGNLSPDLETAKAGRESIERITRSLDDSLSGWQRTTRSTIP